jgi:hypothetical protein
VINIAVRLDGHSFTVPLPDGNRFHARSTWQEEAEGWHAGAGRSDVLLSTFRQQGQDCTVFTYLQVPSPPAVSSILGSESS